jgi:type IV pilus assembly protein PilB
MSTPLRERPDAPLGTLIFRAGLLPAETIENALEEGVKTGRRLGEILIERGLLQEEDLTRLLAGQKGLPFVSLRSEPIDPEATKLLSEDQARLFSALPIRFEEGLPLVAVADPTNDVLNRNIREALGQDVRFVVAGRTELNEIIGEVYSGMLRTVTPGPVVETEPGPESEPETFEATPLRVDTSIPPMAEEPPAPTFETAPELASDPEPEAAPEPEPDLAPEPVPAFEVAEQAPSFEPPAYEAATPVEPESEQVPEPAAEHVPEPAPEPEPVLEPAATFEAPAPAVEFEPAAPAYEAPDEPAPEIPVATEPVGPPSVPETNGQVPHDDDVELGAPPTAAPVPELAPEPTPEPTPAAAAPNAPAPANGAGFTVSVRLTSGERLTVAECGDIGEAKGYAKALTKQLGTTDPDDWPFVNGRFLKPDTIVSVDVEQS